MAPRATFKNVGATGTTTPRSQRSAAATTPRSRSGSGNKPHGTILVNLDVLIHRANIGRDISPNDEDLIVLFRRNSKEVTSEPARWSADHVAVWNQHLGIQTSLLKHKKGGATEFLKKEYEVVLVALPSHSAVALFSVDFATLVQLNASPQERHKSFRISPLKCRDLAATLEFDITWELVNGASDSPSAQPNMLLHPTSNPHALAGLPPSSTLLGKNHAASQAAKAQTPKSRRGTNDAASSTSTRRTTASVSSQGSERELMEELASSNCSSCRSAKRRLERKEVQVLQLESFLKESQKRIDALAAENEELTTREKAETRNAAQQRALSLRLLQELETAVQLCNSQMQNQPQLSDAELLPQVELLERVKKYHEEVDPLRGHSEGSRRSQASQASQTAFDFRAETEAALQRNQRLHQQLEFLGRSMDYDSEEHEGGTRSQRAATDASGTTISSAASGSVTVECEARPVALTMTQQINNLERENFKLKAQLEDALNNAANAFKKHSGGYPSGLSLTAEVSETTSCSSREELDEPEQEDAALLSRIREQHELEAGRSAALESELETAKKAVDQLKKQLESAQNDSASANEAQQAPGFLDKIYADVGKAKLVLEDRVKQLNEMLSKATEENGRLRCEIEELQTQNAAATNAETAAETSEYIAELESVLETREKELKANESALATTKQQLAAAEARVRSGESTKRELESELAGVRLSLKMAQEQATQLENQLAAMATAAPATSASFVSHHSVASDATAHNEELADVQKQLKLSKQEVMQLRFRSNQLESVNERLEDVLKEKRTLEVKLTALEGQLFEQRNRTITDNSSFTAPSLDAKSSAMLTEMQRELDQKSAQLLIAEREVEHLRSELGGGQGDGGSLGNIEDMAAKVKRFEDEIEHLCERNDDQAKRLAKLGSRVTVALRERDELEAIVQQMVAEMALLGKPVDLSSSRTHRTPSIPEIDEVEEKPSRRMPPPPVQTGKITDRYASAVASSSSHSAHSPTPGVTSSKVAQLMKNFSSAGSETSSPGVSPSGVAFKRPTKLDFRNRKGSSTSNGATPTSRFHRVPSSSAQLF